LDTESERIAQKAMDEAPRGGNLSVALLLYVLQCKSSATAAMGVGRISSGVGNSGFFRGRPKSFPGATKSGENSCCPLETKKTTSIAKNLIGKCQISKSWGFGLPCPPWNASDAAEENTVCWQKCIC